MTIPYALLLELYESQVYDAYYNPQTIYGPGRPEALEFIAKMNEFVAEQDQYEEE